MTGSDSVSRGAQKDAQMGLTSEPAARPYDVFWKLINYRFWQHEINIYRKQRRRA